MRYLFGLVRVLALGASSTVGCGSDEGPRLDPQCEGIELREDAFFEATIDAEANTITVDVSDDEMAKRLAAWKAPAYKASRGTLYKYIKNVKSASEGCVTDE